MKKVLFSMGLLAMMLLSLRGVAQTTYTMVNSASQLEPGQYILVGYDNDGNPFAMGYQKSNNRHAIAVSDNGGVVTATVATDPTSQEDTFEFTLDGGPGAWTIYDPLNNGYLNAPGGGNYLRTQSELTDNGRWTITDGAEGGMVPVSNGGVEQCYMRYNITSTLFGCYKESSNVAAPIYFFKAGGTVEPDPEPTSYPTNFTVLVSGVDVAMFWNDATGEQLPEKYLIVGSAGDIPVPVDGTPVANAALAQNVSYGVQTATFSGLDGNTTYHFAIFPYTNSGSYIDYKTDGNYPTDSITTENVDIMLFEDFDVDLGVFTAYNSYGEQEWHQGNYQGITYANMNGYSGGAHQNEDWLISPVINIEANVWDEVDLEFSTAMKFDGNPLQVKFSTSYDGVSDPFEFEWEDITDAFDFSTGNYEWVESGPYMMFDLEPGDYYFAFVYTSTDEAASSWEIDYVKLTGKKTVSVKETSQQVLSIYPNPAREQVSVELESDAQVSIFDVTGRMVSMMNCEAGQAQLGVSELENGVYFVNVRYANGTTAVSKFVKF